jgi:HK97 family phage prohead protease
MSALALHRRLYGGANRVHWTPAQVSRLCARYGVPDKALPEPVLVGAPRESDDAGGSARTYRFTISTPSVDRMGDTIAVQGWDLSDYHRNPIVLFGHNSDALPVGRATRVWTEGNRLKAEMRFAATSFAERVRKQVESRVLNATSVGFRPLEFSFSRDPQRQLGIDFTKAELLEFSIVTVPANAEALYEGTVGSKGFTSEQMKRQREVELARLRIGA